MENEQSLFCLFCIICFICILGWISNICGGGILPVVIGSVVGAWVAILIIENAGFRDASVEVAITNAICMPALPIIWDFLLVKEWYSKRKAEKEAETARLRRLQTEKLIHSTQLELDSIEKKIDNRRVHMNFTQLLESCNDSDISMMNDAHFSEIRQLSMDADRLRRKISELKTML